MKVRARKSASPRAWSRGRHAGDRRLAALAKALGHPARVAIVRRLASDGECICGELVAGVPLAQSTVSQHLRQLERAGLVNGCRRGTKVCYCLDPDALHELGMLLDSLRRGA